MATLAQDTFARADSSSGLGTASDGQTWSTFSGSGLAGIASNEGYLQGGSPFPTTIIGAKTTKNINALMRVSQNGNTGDAVGPCFRYQSAGNQYFVNLFDGVVFASLVGGNFTSLASGSIPSLPVNGYYHLRVVMQNNHCQVRVWPDDGSAEPGTWNIDTTDSTWSGAGQFGLTTNGGGTQVFVDHMTVTDNVAGSTFLHRKNRIGMVFP